MHVARLAIVACWACSLACANAIVRPAVAPSKTAADALHVLPGFGYNRAAEHAFQSLAPSMAAECLDLYLPMFISRSGREGLDGRRAGERVQRGQAVGDGQRFEERPAIHVGVHAVEQRDTHRPACLFFPSG
jgi:hypothetical protein